MPTTQINICFETRLFDGGLEFPMSETEHTYLCPGSKLGDFVVKELIGVGGYGQIYEVVDSSTDVRRAMKVEFFDAEKQGMKLEVKIMKRLQGTCFFPELITTGRTDSFRFFVMELLGPSISQVRSALKSKCYSRYSYLRIAYHSLRCIKAMHKRGMLHRDIKPGNFLIRPDRRNPVALIDFGLSRSYISKRTGEHRPPREDPGFTGTFRYASLHAHHQTELSRRDDLISWFYMLTELALGHTPWPGSDNRAKTIRMKEEMTVEELCKPFPREFIRIWNSINNLGYEEEPNYKLIKELLVRAMRNEKVKDHRYDWEKLPKKTIAELTGMKLDMGPPSSASGEETALEEPEVASGGCCCSVA